jgi:acetoin utilization deacetylase AcuC-like enzyme
MALHAWSSAHYIFPLPPDHRFPIQKYAMIRDRVLREGLVSTENMHDPARAHRDELLRVHTVEYVAAVDTGTLTPEQLRRLGFPWSPALVERSYRAVGGTCEAALYAVDHGIAMNLAGGTHHAFADRGEGFCVFNDVAVAIRMLQHQGRIERATIVDLDVHQGDGTHAIFAGDASVFTFSMHGQGNFPFTKVSGCVDIAFADGVDDHAYLSALSDALPTVIHQSRPDIVFFLAGADPHEGDRLGKMKLTFDGLIRRDSLVLEACREIGLPVVLTIAGGYGRNLQDTVQIHVNTVRVAKQFASSN